MRRRPRSRRQVAFLPVGCQYHGVESQVRQRTYDRLGTVKCPRCGAPLVAKMGRGGPYFHCQCLKRKAA